MLRLLSTLHANYDSELSFDSLLNELANDSMTGLVKNSVRVLVLDLPLVLNPIIGQQRELVTVRQSINVLRGLIAEAIDLATRALAALKCLGESFVKILQLLLKQLPVLLFQLVGNATSIRHGVK